MEPILVDTPVLLRCYYAFVLQILECSAPWNQLLTVTIRFLDARCVRWPGFAFIIVYCRSITVVTLLDCVCWSRSTPPGAVNGL